MELTHLHHTAIICSDEEKTLEFYCGKLGFQVIRLVRRPEQKDTLIMVRKGDVVLELFIRPWAPSRVTDPEAMGLRHLAFRTADIEADAAWLKGLGIETEPIREDPINGGRMTFFQDPDGLPLELHE